MQLQLIESIKNNSKRVINRIFLDLCGHRLEAYKESQELTSPGFPFKHPENQICSWSVIAPSNHVIELNVEQASAETCCDRVQVK